MEHAGWEGFGELHLHVEIGFRLDGTSERRGERLQGRQYPIGLVERTGVADVQVGDRLPIEGETGVEVEGEVVGRGGGDIAVDARDAWELF